MTEAVLIVGAGPVGLTMALELARYHVPVRLIDRMCERVYTSRAVAVWPRTLELLERAGGGLSAELVSRGNQVAVGNIVAGEETIARLEFDDVVTPYPFVLMLPQSDTETVLARHLDARGVRPELGVELAGFTQDADGIDATLRHSDGREEAARFGWMVACDGAHSPVRHALGLSFEGDTRGDEWGQGDFHMSGVPFPLNEFATYWHADGPLVLFPMAPGRYRLIACLGPAREGEPAAPSIEAFQAILDRRGPGGITLNDTVWTSAFRINERQVEHYRSGRVFLAGDSAHVHSPAGGQGMNTGMQDAINLAWKLALVHRGLSRSSVLLDSYESERHAVGAQVIALSGRITRLATISNPVAQRIRNAVAHFVLGLEPVQRAIEGTMTETSIAYEDSPLNGVSWQSGPRAGERMPPLADEAPYGAGDTPRFTLRAHHAAGVPPAFGDLVDPDVRPNPVPGGIELVRPDGYLALSAAEGEWDLVREYLARL